MKRTHYSPAQLADFWRQDQLADAIASEHQAEHGPFYPGITRETLLAYAAECRAAADHIPAQFAHSHAPNL